MASNVAKAPVSEIDPWSDSVLSDPYEHYRQLREIGPAVWLETHGVWALTRYEFVRKALRDASAFVSSEGISMNEASNQASKGLMLTTDDPEHLRLRRVFTRPLLPKSLVDLREKLNAAADAHVAKLVEKGQFDAVPELAHYLPFTVVTELVGFTDEGKRHMLEWAAGIFDGLGPDPGRYARTQAGLDVTREAMKYLHSLDRGDLDPNGWGAALFDAADDGKLTHSEAKKMLMDYLAPALDTTINGTSAAIWLLGTHPDQWALLRKDADLVDATINEALRLESPVRGFTRVLIRDYEIDGIKLRNGDRVLMLYGCANRDERKYPQPDRFDITRNPRDHLGFGFGTHACAGMHLAKREISAVLTSFIRRVNNFRVIEAEHNVHNTLRGLSTLVLEVKPS